MRIVLKRPDKSAAETTCVASGNEFAPWLVCPKTELIEYLTNIAFGHLFTRIPQSLEAVASMDLYAGSV